MNSLDPLRRPQSTQRIGMLVILALGIYFDAVAVSASTFRLYYLGGQSNMDGFGRGDELPEEERAQLISEGAKVWIFHGSPSPDGALADGQPAGSRGLWAPLQPGHGTGFSSDGKENHYSKLFGPELSMASELLRAFPGERIALLKYSRGGTAIAAQAAGTFGSWDPDWAGGEGAARGINQLDHFLAALQAATAVPDIDGDGEDDTLVPAGIVWTQGESDARLQGAAQGYEDNLRRLIGRLRSALRVDGLPVVIGRISDSGRDVDGRVWDFADIVRDAQARFVAGDFDRGGLATLVTSTDGYSYFDPYHYDTAGFLDLGRRFAGALVDLEAVARANSFADPDYEAVHLGPGVFVLRPHAGLDPSNLSNSFLVLGREAALLVDSRNDPVQAQRLVGSIRALTSLPLRYLVNTHWHGDHIQGNQTLVDAFPGLRVIAQRSAQEPMATTAPQRLQEEIERWRARIARARTQVETRSGPQGQLDDEAVLQLRGAIVRAEERTAALVSIRFRAADQWVDQETLLDLGGRQVRLFWPGPAHTVGDLVVDIPDADLILVGDLLEEGLPYLGDGDVAGWANALVTIEAIGRAWVAPSHARDFLAGRRLLELQRSFAQAVLAAAAGSVESFDAQRASESLQIFAEEMSLGNERLRARFPEFSAELLALARR